MPELILSGVIGVDVTPSDVKQKLDQFQAEGITEIDLIIHSPGGDVFDGVSIYNYLRDFKRENSKIDVYINGLAASIATYISMIGDTIYVEENSIWMIHNPWVLVAGDYRELQKSANNLNSLTQVLANAYSEKTKKTVDEIRNAMDEELWLYGKEIITFGFADVLISNAQETEQPQEEEIIQAKKIVASVYAKLQSKIEKIENSQTLSLFRKCYATGNLKLFEDYLSNKKSLQQVMSEIETNWVERTGPNHFQVVTVTSAKTDPWESVIAKFNNRRLKKC